MTTLDMQKRPAIGYKEYVVSSYQVVVEGSRQYVVFTLISQNVLG